MVLPDGERFVPLEQVIAAHLDQLFPGMEIVDDYSFRVTRNADLTLEEEEADDLLAAVEIELRRRRFGRAVRLEVDADASDEVRELLQRELDVDDDDVYLARRPARPRRAVVGARARPPRPEGSASIVPVTPPAFMAGEEGDVGRLRARSAARDVLVHHPYECFAATVEEFVRQAAADPKVLAIKLTLYRTSGDSPIVRSLIRAAERGKQVAALVELKARFDEQANIEWATSARRSGRARRLRPRRAEDAHEDRARRARRARRHPPLLHIGTGNYNATTAKLYEDLGLLTTRRRPRRRPHAAVQLPHRLRPQRAVPEAARSRPTRCGTASRT